MIAVHGDFDERLARVEAQLAIRQLAARYAVAVDARDLDSLVALFVDDVDCGRFGTGRDALRAFYTPVLQRFYRSVHHNGGHTIDLTDGDHATGKVYCRAEHEVGDEWIVQLLCYHDDYERRDGEWQFARRRPLSWLSTDVLQRPSGPEFEKWASQRPAALPGRFPAWRPFWAAAGADAEAKVTSAPR